MHLTQIKSIVWLHLIINDHPLSTPPTSRSNLDQAWIPGISALEVGGATWQPTGRVKRSNDAGPAPEEVPEGTGSRKLLQDTMWVDGAEYAKSG